MLHLLVLLVFLALISHARAGYLGLLDPNFPVPVHKDLSTFTIPHKSSSPLKIFFLDSEDPSELWAHPSVIHMELDRPAFTRRPVLQKRNENKESASTRIKHDRIAHDSLLHMQKETEARQLLPRSVQNHQRVTANASASWGLDRIDGTADGLFTYPASAGSGITIFVLDSGIEPSLEEFSGRAERGPNYTNETSDDDLDGHGTFCSAIVAGTTYGVAKNATVVGVKVIREGGIGRVSDIVRGLVWVVNVTKNGTAFPSVISLSVGTDQSTIFDQALNYIVDLGIPITAASGNEGEDACNWSPGSALAVLTASATNQTENRASFYSNYGPCVKIWAPGTEIASIFPNGTEVIQSGTSFASPFVAGAIALYWAELLQTNPNATGQDAMNVLGQNATHTVTGLPFFGRTTDLFLRTPAV